MRKGRGDTLQILQISTIDAMRDGVESLPLGVMKSGDIQSCRTSLPEW